MSAAIENHPNGDCLDTILVGDAREILPTLPEESVDLSFWSPPYYVGKSYEEHLSFSGWQELLREVVRLHVPVVKPGGFMAVNIGDILCFPDPSMPRIQADNVRRKKCSVTREDVLATMETNPGANRYRLAELLGCSEQTVQRRLEHNNVKGRQAAGVHEGCAHRLHGRGMG